MMGVEELRALWLVLHREYFERVKSFSFIASTFVAPVLFMALAATPVFFTASQIARPKRIAVACDTLEMARQIADTFRHWKFSQYRVETASSASPHEREKLIAMVRESRLEGFLWLDRGALASGHIVYTSRAGLDSIEREVLRANIEQALVRARLAANGLTRGEIDRSLQPIVLDSFSLREKAGGPRRDGALAAIVVTVSIITILEMSLLSYGIIVMRSVLEDKTSRMVEILLCSVTTRALMAGKILGIGALSLTQVIIWGAIAAVSITGAARFAGLDLASNPGPGFAPLVLFAVFYVLGYLLYSSLYAALGAAFNTADDAQYWSFILTLPLLFAGIAAWSLFEQADSAIAVALSLVPPLAPVVMSMRIAVGVASTWEIGLSLVLLAVSIYAAWALSAQIYRVGTLMYGKKPGLREVARWLRYA